MFDVVVNSTQHFILIIKANKYIVYQKNIFKFHTLKHICVCLKLRVDFELYQIVNGTNMLFMFSFALKWKPIKFEYSTGLLRNQLSFQLKQGKSIKLQNASEHVTTHSTLCSCYKVNNYLTNKSPPKYIKREFIKHTI